MRHYAFSLDRRNFKKIYTPFEFCFSNKNIYKLLLEKELEEVHRPTGDDHHAGAPIVAWAHCRRRRAAALYSEGRGRR